MSSFGPPPDAGPIWRRRLRLSICSRADGVALLVLAALVVVLLPRAMLLGEVFYERDLTFDWVTQVESFVRCVAQGSWPLWDNSVGFGQPLLADPSAEILYPPTWLNLVLSPWRYYVLFASGHLLLGGCGTFALARRLGASRPAAVTAGGLFIASGPMLSLLNVYHHFAGAAWMPWVALGAEATAETGRLRSALAWTAALAAQLLAGSADMVAMGMALAAALVLRRISWRAPFSLPNRRRVGLSALAVVLAGGLAAAQWLPTLAQAALSQRLAMPASVRTAWSVTPWGLLQTLLPTPLWDVPLSTAARAALTPWGEPFLRSLYLGLPLLALALAALARGASTPRVTLVGVGAAATLFALGPFTPFYGVSTTVLPLLRVFRYPSKAMTLTALCMALLAGLGLDSWNAVPRRRRLLGVVMPVAVGAALTVLAALAAATGRAAALMPPETPAALLAETLRPVTVQLALGALLGIAALALAILGRGAVAMGALAAVALVAVGWDVNRTTRAALLDGRPPVLDRIAPASAASHLGAPRLYVFEYLRDPERTRRYLHRDDPYPFRVPPGANLQDVQVLSQRLYPFPPAAGRWGIEGSFDSDFRATQPVYLADMSRLLIRAERTPLHTWLLRLGAVGHVVALHREGLSDLEEVAALPTLYPEPARLYRVPQPLPRAYLVSGARPGGDWTALVAFARAGDPRRAALIDGLSAAVPSDSGFSGTVHRFDLRPDRVHAEVEANAPAWLVMVDAFDRDWHARVDGARARLWRANTAFRAVSVPAGRHFVDLAYRPPEIAAGLALSGVTLVAFVALCLATRKTARGPAA